MSWAGRTGGRRVELMVFGLAVASNAVGSVLFHGLQWWGARWMHDLGIASVLLFIVVYGAARYLSRPTSWTVAAYVVALGIVGLLLGVAPLSTYGVYALLGVGVGASELAEHRHELLVIRAERLSARRLARIGVLVALALAATAFFVGRTGAPLCNPESSFQWHAAWHVLAAAAMGLYAYGAIEPHPASTRTR